MTDRKGTPSDASESSPERDPLDVTDLPENETEDSDVRGGASFSDGFSSIVTQRCMAPQSGSCLPDSAGCPPISSICPR